MSDEAPSDARYTHGHHDAVLRSHSWRTVSNSAPHLAPHLRAGMDVLDVGCGPGTITLDLAERVAPGAVVGVDSSDVAIQHAASAAIGTTGVSFRVADVHALPFEDARFDVVHAHQVLQHLADPVAALREMRRVCRPGGLVAVRDADYAAFTWAPHEPLLERWLALYRSLARHNGGEPDAGRQLLGWLHAAGFDDIDPGASLWCFATPADRAWWAGTWAQRMTDSAVAEQLVELGAATEEELSDISEAFERWAAHEDGWFVVLHGEAIARA